MSLVAFVFPLDGPNLQLEFLYLLVFFLNDILQIDNFSNGAVIPLVTFVMLYRFLEPLYHLIGVLQLVAAVVHRFALYSGSFKFELCCLL